MLPPRDGRTKPIGLFFSPGVFFVWKLSFLYACQSTRASTSVLQPVYVQCRTTLHVMLQIAPDWARGAGCTRGPINKVAVFLSCCRPDRGMHARRSLSFVYGPKGWKAIGLYIDTQHPPNPTTSQPVQPNHLPPARDQPSLPPPPDRILPPDSLRARAARCEREIMWRRTLPPPVSFLHQRPPPRPSITTAPDHPLIPSRLRPRLPPRPAPSLNI